MSRLDCSRCSAPLVARLPAACAGCGSPSASTTWRAPLSGSPDVGGYRAPLNIVLLAAALIGAVGVWWWPPIGWLSLALVVGPVGLSLTGTSSSLRWTSRLRRVAAFIGVVVIGMHRRAHRKRRAGLEPLGGSGDSSDRRLGPGGDGTVREARRQRALGDAGRRQARRLGGEGRGDHRQLRQDHDQGLRPPSALGPHVTWSPRRHRSTTGWAWPVPSTST